jgi:hypothetical protein
MSASDDKKTVLVYVYIQHFFCWEDHYLLLLLLLLECTQNNRGSATTPGEYPTFRDRKVESASLRDVLAV